MDKKEALERIKEVGADLENLSDEFKKDKEIVLEFCSLYHLKHCSYNFHKLQKI